MLLNKFSVTDLLPEVKSMHLLRMRRHYCHVSNTQHCTDSEFVWTFSCVIHSVPECDTQMKMTDGNSVEHLSVVMTTETVNDVTQATTANVMTSSSSYGIEFYFQCAVVFIGVVGTAANAVILYAMVASKQHKKHVLIFNQNALDFFSCLLLVITYALKLCNIHLSGLTGYWLCILILSENLIWCVILASKTNLVFVDQLGLCYHWTLSEGCLSCLE